jgi:hypothetical protein
MKSNIEIEKGWLIELQHPETKRWTPVSSRPIHKLRARKAARLWEKDFKIKARIRQVEITTNTLAIETNV